MQGNQGLEDKYYQLGQGDEAMQSARTAVKTSDMVSNLHSWHHI